MNGEQSEAEMRFWVFPDGWNGGDGGVDDECTEALEARRLVELGEQWVNPPEWIE